MTKTTINEFEPDYIVHPGQVLEETLEAQGLSKKEFAERVGITPKTVSLIVSGIGPVTPDTAIAFQRVLGISANIWINLNAEYRLFKARQKAQEELKSAIEWSKKFPLSDLTKRGIIPSGLSAAKKVGVLLDFFRVRGPDEWDVRYGDMNVIFRSSPAFKSNYEAVITWLRLAELRADTIETTPYDKALFRGALEEIRTLTEEDSETFEPRMKELCMRAGVALVMVSELPGTHLSGATRWLTNDKAMIALSFRHKSNDHFWFTFFHEAAHILKHGRNDVHIDEPKGTRKTVHESEADNYAANFLVPRKSYNEFISDNTFDKDSVREFASSVGVAPGIIVGRLQHDEIIEYSWLNDLKVKFQLVEN